MVPLVHLWAHGDMQPDHEEATAEYTQGTTMHDIETAVL